MRFLFALLFGMIIAAAGGCDQKVREVRGMVVDVQFLGEQYDALLQVKFEDGRTCLYRVSDLNPPDIHVGKEQRLFVRGSNYIDRVEIVEK